MTLNLPRKHHYIPKFLLKNFISGKKKQVWVYDKSTDRKFRAALGKIAAARDLYSFEEEGYVFSVEPSLAKLEGQWASVIRKIISKDSIDGLTITEKVQVAIMLVHLRLRAPNHALSWSNAMEDLRQRIRDLGGDPETIEEIKTLAPEVEKRLNIQLLQNLPGKLAPSLVMKRWALFSASPSANFYLSDNPIVMHNQRVSPGRGNLGFDVAGIEIYLPINPKRCLAVSCPSNLPDSPVPNLPYPPEELIDKQEVNRLLNDESELTQKHMEFYPPLNDGNPIPLPAESVQWLSSCQVFNAEQYLYSSLDDFSLAEEMIRGDDTLRQGPRIITT